VISSLSQRSVRLSAEEFDRVFAALSGIGVRTYGDEYDVIPDLVKTILAYNHDLLGRAVRQLHRIRSEDLRSRVLNGISSMFEKNFFDYVERDQAEVIAGLLIGGKSGTKMQRSLRECLEAMADKNPDITHYLVELSGDPRYIAGSKLLIGVVEKVL